MASKEETQIGDFISPLYRSRNRRANSDRSPGAPGDGSPQVYNSSTMWRRREFLTGLGTAAAARPAARARRNLLLIVVDGQRSDMVGVAGNRLLRTPHIDALAM